MARERVVYILGAGFSAPAGLPVMSNFLIRSKDLFFGDETRFKNFSAVFATIQRMAVAKNYFKTDLFNIEEILSILDMEEYVSGTRRRADFTKYVADVINALTPEFRVKLNSPVAPNMFVEGSTPSRYCQFVANLARLRVSATDTTDEYRLDAGINAGPDYGVITLNYDVLLERAVNTLNTRCQKGPRIEVATSLKELAASPSAIPIAKLHGSVEPLTIVPPTWRKGAHKGVRDAWALASTLVSSANQIRIIGYSLPPTDTYIRYLLMNAATDARHLKSIDVGCLDPDGTVAARFAEFVSFFRYRFREVDTNKYLGDMHRRASVNQNGKYMHIDFTQLEPVHEHSFA